MRIIFFGDVFAGPGRAAVHAALRDIVPGLKPDFVIINGENAAHGHGILPEMVDEFLSAGVDLITLGNHAWDQKTLLPTLASSTRIIRPANYPDFPTHRVPGRGGVVVESRRRSGCRLGVFQVLGRVFMQTLDCPFRAADTWIEKFDELDVTCILADFHGEATSEKQAFAHYVDGRIGAVVGTHSHVQTADERILKRGTAAITDVGMCGYFDSVIGMRKDLSIERFLTQRKVRFEPAEGVGGISAVVIDLDDATGRAVSIERIFRTEV